MPTNNLRVNLITMDVVVQIFSVGLLIAASALCIFLIIYIKKIVEEIGEVRKDVHQLSQNLIPLVDSLQSLSNSVADVSDDVKNQISKLRWIFDELKRRFEKIFEFESKMKKAVETPANNLINNLQALKKGVSTFFDVMRK